MILACICWFVAGILVAVMDKITHHFDISIFNNPKIFNRLYWDPAVSWRNKYENYGLPPYKRKEIRGTAFKVPVIFTDAWHLFKWLALSLLGVSVLVYSPFINPFIDLLIIGASFGVAFTLFYSHLLVKK
jgi:hypothetical protein